MDANEVSSKTIARVRKLWKRGPGPRNELSLLMGDEDSLPKTTKEPASGTLPDRLPGNLVRCNSNISSSSASSGSSMSSGQSGLSLNELVQVGALPSIPS